MFDQKSKRKNIVIADDDPAIVDALQFMLEEAGYKVKSTVDGDKVKNLVRNKPDLLLLDIWMSGEDGRAICQQIKSRPNTKNLPVIMISANKDTRKYAKESGADDFIEKPFEMDELLSKVERYIDN